MYKRTKEKRKHKYDRYRENSNQRGYGYDWVKCRVAFLRNNPKCWCGLTATEVDHVISVADRPDLRLDDSNLRSLCKKHHSRRTMRDQGPNKDKQNAMETNALGLPADPNHPWNKMKP